MVELDSYSSVDWPDSGVNCNKAEALKANSPTSQIITLHFRLLRKRRISISGAR
jgi:hypothetical protein